MWNTSDRSGGSRSRPCCGVKSKGLSGESRRSDRWLRSIDMDRSGGVDTSDRGHFGSFGDTEDRSGDTERPSDVGGSNIMHSFVDTVKSDPAIARSIKLGVKANELDDGVASVIEMSDRTHLLFKTEEKHLKSNADDSVTHESKKSSRDQNRSKSNQLTVKSDIDICKHTESEFNATVIPEVGFAGIKSDQVKLRDKAESKPSTFKVIDRQPTRCKAKETSFTNISTRINLKMAWLEAQSSQSVDFGTRLLSSSQPHRHKVDTESKQQLIGNSDSKLNLNVDNAVQSKPVSKPHVINKPSNKTVLEFKVIKDRENLGVRFTNVDRAVPKRKNIEDMSYTESPKYEESDLGILLRDDDLQTDNTHDTGERKSYKDYEKSGNVSSEESSSSLAKTSVNMTEDTDLSDDNPTSPACTDSLSGKEVTARKVSSSIVTLTEAELDSMDEIATVKMRDHPSRHVESDYTVLVKVKPISDECSEVQTSEDNLSLLEDDDDTAVPLLRKTVSVGDITFKDRERGQENLTYSEEAMPSLLTEIKMKDKRKHGLTSSEESISPVTKSNSETDTKESWIEFKSESTTASKKGLTSSDEVLTSGKSDVSKKKDEANYISSRDRIQNLISDTKTVRSRIRGAGLFADLERLGGIDPRLPREASESEESGISADTDSSSTIEIQRISERLLPIGGTITLIKGKPPSERSTTPSWGSMSSLLDGLTWEKRAAEHEPSDISLNSSLSTLHRETPIQELTQISRDTPQKIKIATPIAEIKPQISEKQFSDSDTSSEESRQHKKITCEQVIRGATADDEEVFMTAHYCIDTLTFGIRRSLSEEKLYSIEADTQAHRKRKPSSNVLPVTSNIFHDRACDACTFLVLLQTLIVRERAIHFAFRKVDACLVHNIGLGSQNAHIFSYLLKRMPVCEFCTFPSVEKMILQLVQSRHGVLMHKADHLAPIYVIFPPYSEKNRTIGRVVHLKKKKVSDYAVKPKLRVMIADRYILFPKFHDACVWERSPTLKHVDVPSKRKVSKIKGKTVPMIMADIPELNESAVDEPRQKTNGHKISKGTPIKKRPAKKKAKKCVLKKWSPVMASNVQPTRRNGSSSDEAISPNVIGTKKCSEVLAETIASKNRRRRFILKKWTVKLSPKSKRKLSIRKYYQLIQEQSPKISKSDTTDKPNKIKAKSDLTKPIASDISQLEHKQVDGVVLVRKKRPWWKCPRRKKSEVQKKPVDPTPKTNPDLYKKLLHPSYQQPLFSYRIKSRTGQVETRVLTRQDVLAQRLAYHYIRELAVCQTDSSKEQKEDMKGIKPSLTDFQSREYEKRRTFIQETRESIEVTQAQIHQEGKHDVSDGEDSDTAIGPESPLDLAKYDLSQIEYHFKNCPIVLEGKTPYKRFLKLQQVFKTTDFQDSWVEYHVEDCRYFMIDGTTITDIKATHLVLAEKNDTTCDCAEKLIKGGNIYLKDKSSSTFHHDLCLLFPKQLETGEVDLQGLFNPNIPTREFHENDVLRLYFITQKQDKKDPRIVDFCDVPLRKLTEIQDNINFRFNLLCNKVDKMAAGAKDSEELKSSDEIASTSKMPVKASHLKLLGDFSDDADHDEIVEYHRFVSPPKVDSESEDSTTVYSLEECLIYASEHMTDDSISPPPEPRKLSDSQIHKQSECSAEIGLFRRLTPSPRPVDLNQVDKMFECRSAQVSPRQERGSEGQIYYHLGEFQTQIQKRFSAEQRAVSLRQTTNEDATLHQAGKAGRKHFSYPTSRLTSPERDIKQKLQAEMHQREQKMEEKSHLRIPRRVHSQESSCQYLKPSRQIDDRLRFGNSLDSIQRRRGKYKDDFEALGLQSEAYIHKYKASERRRDVRPERQDQRKHGIHSQECINRFCTCNVPGTIELARIVVEYCEKNLAKHNTMCPLHNSRLHQPECPKNRAYSQGDISLNQGLFHNESGERLRQLSLYDQGLELDQTSVPSKQEIRAQRSHQSFGETNESCKRSRSQDVPSSKYSLAAVLSPTRVLDSRKDSLVRTSETRINTQRTWSHGDLHSKRLSVFNQELRDERPPKPQKICMKAVVIPDIGKDDQCVPQENVVEGARQKDATPSFQWTDRRRQERFKNLPEDQGCSSKKPGTKKNDGNDCPHLWKRWRDGPAPF